MLDLRHQIRVDSKFPGTPRKLNTFTYKRVIFLNYVGGGHCSWKGHLRSLREDINFKNLFNIILGELDIKRTFSILSKFRQKLQRPKIIQ